MAIKEMRSLNFGGEDTYIPVPTDWNQTDETQPDFLKNKPFGDVPTVILEEQELAFDPEMGIMAPVSAPINDGDNLTVVFDGVSYNCNASFVGTVGAILFGNIGFVGGESTSDEPFMGGYMDGAVFFVTADEENHVIGITVNVVNPIPKKYLASPKFYVKINDNYLYTDSAFTTKATMADVPDSVDFEIGVNVGGNISSWVRPTNVLSKIAASSIGYNIIYFPFNEETGVYTAEYTPKT